MNTSVEMPTETVLSESDSDRFEMSPSSYLDQILDREVRLTLHGIELGSERDDSMRQLTAISCRSCRTPIGQ